jgi:Fe-S oxidoreductase
LPTTLAFRADGSFAGMVEQCNGNGLCRKLEGGVMCPSYRATREEMHSTRGRANLLRAFISENGRYRPDLDEVKAALDLCLSCKACATECAAGVDMSKLKSEFLAHFYAQRGTPLRAWLLGHIGTFSPLAAAFAPLSNWMLRRPWFKRALGLAEPRALPEFTRHTFDRWWRSRPAHTKQARFRAVLFVDTFSRYNHPEVAIAAVRALEAAGGSVIVPPWRCCGRPFMSQGQPVAARNQARFNLAQLAPLAKQGLPILTLEPSCLSMLKDDYRDLWPGETSEVVAQAAMSVEDFLATHLPPLEGTPDAQQVLLHGHCHQKALWGTQGTRALLEAAGYRVIEIESTCCGMAGAFGYEAEHYALSHKIGELNLLPAVRTAAADALVAAPGTSCREQIQHFTGRSAWHPVVLIAQRLARSLAAG